MEKYLKYLQRIDMFGNRIELSYYKEKTHKTKFGGFLTILLVIFSALAINYFGQEIINKNEPNVTTEEHYLMDSQIKDCCFQNEETDTLIIALRVVDYQQKTMENNEIYITALIYEQDLSNDENQEVGSNNQMNLEVQMKAVEMESISCISQEKMYTEIANKDEFDFNSLLCYRMKAGQLTQDKGLVRFEFHVNLKQNTSLQRGILEIYYTELALDVSQYNNPGVYYLNKRIYSFEQGQVRRLPILLKTVVLETDQGFILSEYERTSFLMPKIQGEISQQSQYIDDNKKNSILTMEFQMDRKYQLTRRSYLKLQNFLSSVGGIIKVFSMVFIFLSKKLTKLDFYMNLLNQIFNFEDPNGDYQKINHDDDSSGDEDEDEEIQKQGNQVILGNGVSAMNKNLTDLEKQQNFLNQLQRSINKNSKTLSQEQHGEKKLENSQETKKKRKVSLEKIKATQEDNMKSDTQIPLKRSKFSKNKLQNVYPSFGTILQNTETLIPLQLLSNPNHNQDDGEEEESLSPKEANSDEKPKQIEQEIEKEKEQKDQIKIDIKILQDLDESDEKNSSLKKQVRKLERNQNKYYEDNKDEECGEKRHKDDNDNEDQKRNTVLRRRNAIPKNTMLISKFMHKVRSLLHNEEADTEKIETIKKKLNHQGNKYIQPENKPLKWGFLDYIQNIFCFGKARKKREQMKYCWKKVKERLNAVYIMQKLVELEKLKILLLDEHQLKLFDYLPKPMISLNVVSTDQSSSTSPSFHQVNARKSNEQSRLASLQNAVITPVNPNNTPISQLNIEKQQNLTHENKESNSGGGESHKNNTGQTEPQNQNNENKQIGNNGNKKSNSPQKVKKSINCFGKSSASSKKENQQRQSIIRDRIKKHKENGSAGDNSGNSKPIQKNQNAFHQQWIQLNSRSTPLEKALYAMEAFEFIKNKQIKSAIDIKLVDMLDSRMKKCFEIQDDPVYNEQNVNEEQHNISQFRQFFDGDNTIREFLYPTDQYQNREGIRNNRRARTVGVSSTPRNVSDGNSILNNFNNPSNNNSINQSFMPFNNLNNLMNINNFNSAYTPARRNFNVLPPNYHSNNKNSSYNNNNNFINIENNESVMDFSRYMNEFQQTQNQYSNHLKGNNSFIQNNGNNLLQIQHNGIINRQRSLSPSGQIQAQMKKKHQLKRQQSSMSITSNISNTNNLPKIQAQHNTKNTNANTNNNNIKPSIFLRRLQTYDNNINEEIYKNKNNSTDFNQQLKSHYNNTFQQQQWQQNSFTSSYQINSGTSSKKKIKLNELSSPQKFELDLSSSHESQNKHHNIYTTSLGNLRPSHLSHQQNINSVKNLNLSAIESDLNTIEEDIPQENNTPTTLSKNSNINDSQLRKPNNSFYLQCVNMSQSQISPLKVTEALKKYSISFQTMQQDPSK